MARTNSSRKPLAAKRPPLTHFLCLPLVTTASKPQLDESLKTFREDVSSSIESMSGATPDQTTEGPSGPPIHPKAIRPVGALHCTLGVMSLDNKCLDEAIRLLQSLDISALLSHVAADSRSSTIDSESMSSLTGKPLKIDLKGLVSMHSPERTSILYSAPSDSTDRLYPFCLEVQKLFKDAELLVPDDRELKLHATIVNTIYAKAKGRRPAASRRVGATSATYAAGQSAVASNGTQADGAGQVEGHGLNANAPLKIDARDLLERYRDFVFAKDVVLDRIAICEMGAKKRFDDKGVLIGEEYKEVASVSLPT